MPRKVHRDREQIYYEKGLRCMHKRIRCAVMAAFFIFLSVSGITDSNGLIPLRASAREDALTLYARGAVLMDGDSGRVLYGKEQDTELPMASTTKIMTCIVALEKSQPDTVCTVSAGAAAQPQVKLGMVEGDAFYMKDLLYSLMLESHNDTAVCIAETVAGSVEAFAGKMNAKAAEIGCEHTYYVTPNGLDGEDQNGVHHTTAKELALVMRYCLNESPAAEVFLEITGAESYSFTNISGSRSYSCTNHNALLTILEGAVSGKTGFTGKAGYCYVGAVRRDGKLLIVSLLACGWPNHKGYKWVDTKKLIKYGLENYEKREITDRTLAAQPVEVLDGQLESVNTVILWEEEAAGEDVTDNDGAKIQKMTKNTETDDSMRGTQMQTENSRADTVLMREGEQVQMKMEMIPYLEAPVERGQQVGKVCFLVDQREYASYRIVTAEKVKKRDFRYCLRLLLKQFFL